MPRNLSDWLTGFEQYTEGLSSPALFRRWGGISLLGAALERRVWSTNAIGDLYPNLYIFLVGPPAVGKTILTGLNYTMLSQLEDIKIASSSITKATVIEELAGAQRYAKMGDGKVLSFNSLYICSNELGVLLPEYDRVMMGKLTDIYDAKPYSEKRRDQRHNVDIKRPVLNLLAATQPGFMSTVLPEVAWEQGFLSRVILVYEDKATRQSLFTKRQTDEALYANLMRDLRTISKLAGEITFSPEAIALAEEFWGSGHKLTEPLHPKLQWYNSRRPTQILKLMMISAISRDDTLVIEEADFVRAHDWLVEAEHRMPDIFKAMTAGGDNQIIKDVWYYVYKEGLAKKEGIAEQKLIAYLAERVPAEKVNWIKNIMIEGGLLSRSFDGGQAYFKARGELKF